MLKLFMSIMKDMGITDLNPVFINQLLEFTYRYIACILDDARVFATHAKKKVIDLEDVKLAVQMTVDRAFTTPPPRDILLEVARSKNNTPLPLIKPHCGLRLPPDRYCLSSCNFKLRCNKKPQTKQMHHHTMGGEHRPSTIPKPVIKFSSGAPASKAVAKPKIQMTMPPGNNPTPTIKIENDLSSSLKRKREEDDYDILE
ncbi:hypothetical protein L9F63_028297 [Diploptera punctata]|uniref:Transcription initiation factor TFIID subunit 9 n=1 Tax=Diploptera punctata TaxID=6984 RepID=A0AAD7ZVC5_DIPPU|nr:hypothetical protein L9F63_028297 [Diploptera punctata]